MKIIRVDICRAYGLRNWVASCVYDDGSELIELNLQHPTWQGLIPRARHAYAGIPIRVSGEPYWKRTAWFSTGSEIQA